eukprot:NODE_447_length_1473_cov_164.575843_g330_i0.p1 GENE.NODE_447_length_1473_cov_164.575843_g330_i0~~NODE_447_length_1473_cov_164.575843_g330_i0.p1  ORF type:complete len:425 (+),score=38.30 NODE_447_length_1473_cov_164.575843_g330_i0:58-1332(+)
MMISAKEPEPATPAAFKAAPVSPTCKEPVQGPAEEPALVPPPLKEPVLGPAKEPAPVSPTCKEPVLGPPAAKEPALVSPTFEEHVSAPPAARELVLAPTLPHLAPHSPHLRPKRPRKHLGRPEEVLEVFKLMNDMNPMPVTLRRGRGLVEAWKNLTEMVRERLHCTVYRDTVRRAVERRLTDHRPAALVWPAGAPHVLLELDALLVDVRSKLLEVANINGESQNKRPFPMEQPLIVQDAVVQRSTTPTDVKAKQPLVVQDAAVQRSTTPTDVKAKQPLVVQDAAVQHSTTPTDVKAKPPLVVQDADTGRSTTPTECKSKEDTVEDSSPPPKRPYLTPAPPPTPPATPAPALMSTPTVASTLLPAADVARVLSLSDYFASKFSEKTLLKERRHHFVDGSRGAFCEHCGILAERYQSIEGPKPSCV